MHTCKLPQKASLRFANCLIQRCETAISSTDPDVLFDLSDCVWADPLGITILSGTIHACIQKGSKVTCKRPKSPALDQQLTDIGFYEWGKASGKGRLQNRQAQLRRLTAVEPAYTDQVVAVLAGMVKISGGVKDSIHFSIKELMTNTYDHSKSAEGCFVCAQAYRNRKSVEICFTDFGIGILGALKSVPKYANLTKSMAAIKLAVQEGVTSRTKNFGGLGLKYIHDFLEVNKGKIDIISGNAWLHWDYSASGGVKIKTRALKTEFEGTIVSVRVRANAKGWYYLTTEDPSEDIF